MFAPAAPIRSSSMIKLNEPTAKKSCYYYWSILILVLLFLGLIIQKDRFEFPPSLFFIQLISYAAYVYIYKKPQKQKADICSTDANN